MELKTSKEGLVYASRWHQHCGFLSLGSWALWFQSSAPGELCIRLRRSEHSHSEGELYRWEGSSRQRSSKPPQRAKGLLEVAPLVAPNVSVVLINITIRL